jgi:glycosyltransferase involved in cell wall biosynthesis
MKIGIDARFYGPQGKGLGRYTQKLISYLEKIDKQNEYFILLRRENWHEYEPSRKNFKKVLADYRWYTLKEQILLPLKLHSLHLDLMHFTHFNVPMFYFGKFIVTIHDLILTKYPTQRATTLGPLLYSIKHFSYELVIKMAIKRASRIIAVSEYTKQDIMKHFRVPAEKIKVTHEAVDTPAERQTGLAEKFAVMGISGVYLLYVGNVYPHKNIEGLLKAFSWLVARNGDLKLVLVGKDDYFFTRVKNLVKSMNLQDKVVFPGYVDDNLLAALYQRATVFVFPSFYEGFGLPPLEAMSYGLPVVSSNSSCLPEVLGEAALYFNPHDTKDIAGKISSLLEDKEKAKELVQKGYRRLHVFSWQKMAQATLDLYCSLLFN